MFIIEALKEIKLIEKKIKDNTERINQYASQLSNEKPLMGSENEQKQKIKEMIQTNFDLADRICELNRNINYTNLITKVSFDKKDYFIIDLIKLKQKYGNLILDGLKALNTNSANKKINMFLKQSGESIAPVLFYDENYKYKLLNEWESFLSQIESRLEVINATTELKSLN